MLDLFGNEVSEDLLLRDRFIEPPFSVLDTKSGNWQSRKREWLSRGIKSEIGRDVDPITFHVGEEYGDWQNIFNKKTASIFDPALCELMYEWFCPDGGTILDPFAGGSVRGVVAHFLGYKYTGIDLRHEQVEANRANAKEILKIDNQPRWITGDSDKTLDKINDKFDMVFTCPPYMDLEVYSDDKDDLSNMSDFDFIVKYESIIEKSCEKLSKDGYAVIVIGDVRNKNTGFYKDFISITKTAFRAAGMGLYNDMVLLDPIGTACVRAGHAFEASKKVTKIHQNVLVYKRIQSKAPTKNRAGQGSENG